MPTNEAPTKVEFPATIVVDVWQSDTGLWFATSRMMAGLMCGGKTPAEALEKITIALADLTVICRDNDFTPPSAKG